MAQPPMSVEKMQEAVDAVAKYGSEVAAVKAIKIPRSTLRERLRAANRAGIASGIERPDSPGRLKSTITRLEAALRAKEKQSADIDIIKGVVGNIRHKVEDLDPPEFIINPRKQHGSPGVPTLFLSDLHWAEVVHPSQINGVNQYNLRIARERMQTCVDSAVHLLKILSPKMDYPGIVVPLGGDMISGNIHEELTASNEINSMPAIEDLYGVLRGVITQLANAFGSVFLPCVTGNHGRDTHKIWAKDRHHTSFDWLLYRFLAKSFEGDARIRFYIPDGPDAYYRVYGHRYLLTHGDQFRGGDSMIGALGPLTRGSHKKASRNAAIDMDFDVMICGHWHQYIHLTRLIVNGSLKGYDEYAYNYNFPFEHPQQALWITHPKYKITYRMPVYVDRQRAAPKTAWVSFAG
ncbi:MAG: hypothetical protein Q8R92_16910 [Deltaproteobacteria bacterium]|nr:hypothetical protein [Deltaproteobacteria bacterium]